MKTWKNQSIMTVVIEALTSLCNASVAVPRSAGSMARRVPIRGSDEGGKSLKVSLMHLL